MRKNTSIALSDHFQKFVQELVSQGRFGSSSEVISAGLRLLEEQDVKLAALRSFDVQPWILPFLIDHN
jgi:antitoxin ParD1/3/4